MYVCVCMCVYVCMYVCVCVLANGDSIAKVSVEGWTIKQQATMTNYLTFINKTNKVRHGIHHMQYYMRTIKLQKV